MIELSAPEERRSRFPGCFLLLACTLLKAPTQPLSGEKPMNLNVRFSTSLLVLAVSLADVACSAPESCAELEHASSVASPILGGMADSGDTAVVSLFVTDSSGNPQTSCTASVINVVGTQADVLTAAHCVVTDVARIKVTSGTDPATDFALGHAYPATFVTIHPDYDGVAGNVDDVAIVRISGIPTGLPQLPLLGPAEDQLTPDTNVSLVGFGITEDATEDAANPYGERRVTRQTIAWLDSDLIGFDQSDGHGLCHGDSGGPVLVPRSDGALAIAGINSFVVGSTCDDHATSMRAARFSSFIAHAISMQSEGSSGSSGCSFKRVNSSGHALWAWLAAGVFVGISRSARRARARMGKR